MEARRHWYEADNGGRQPGALDSSMSRIGRSGDVKPIRGYAR